MKNEIVTTQNNGISTQVKYTEEQIKTVKNTVAKGASDDELKMFIGIAEKYGLDPFIKEIWFIKRAKKVKDNKNNWDYKKLPNGEIDYTGAETMIMTSRDGYLKVAQRDANFDGIIGFPVKEGDIFEIDAENYTVVHKFGAKRGKIIGAWAKVTHKTRKPVIVWADFLEYNSANSNIWKQYPSAMIQKVAEVLALKRQFGISGLTTKEEMSTTYDEFEAAQVVEVKNPPAEPKIKMMEQKQKSGIWKQAQSKGMDLNELHVYTMKTIGTPLENLTFDQAQQLTEALMSYEKPEEVEKVEAEILTEQEKEIVGDFKPVNINENEVEI